MYGSDKCKNTFTFECKSVYDDSPEIKEMMLKNLNIEAKKINYNLILAPKQSLSNCWFNAFFMIFFISDKGRKFCRYLCKSMITGITRDQKLKKQYTYTIRGKKVKYVLASAIVRSQNKAHYTCYITGNKRCYGFDGASLSRLKPFDWKSKII